MDTEAYLTSQGWRGHGHALHYSGRGIIKPIHLSQKANVLGVGKKQHDAQADQWWARAFDDTLKSLNTSNNEATEKTNRVSAGSGVQALAIGGARRTGPGDLYGNFVRGESLGGTLIPEKKSHAETQPQPEDDRKQKRGSSDGDLPTALPKDFSRSKKRRRREGATAKYYKLGDFDAVQQNSKCVDFQEEHSKPRERRKEMDSNEQGRQKKRGKGARRFLQAGSSPSPELPKQPRTTTGNDTLKSCRITKRSKEQLRTIKPADPIARPCNMPPDVSTKDESRK